MDFKALIEKILPYAPTVATALDGPIAGTIVSMITSKLGLNPSSTSTIPDSISSILSSIESNPNTQVQIKQLEEDLTKFKFQLSENDTENARQAQISEYRLGKPSIMPNIITIFLMITFVFVLILLFIPTIKMNDSTIAGSMIGLLTREFIQACRFYIGGDADKS